VSESSMVAWPNWLKGKEAVEQQIQRLEISDPYRILTPEQFRAGYVVPDGLPSDTCIRVCNIPYTFIKKLDNGNFVVIDPAHEERQRLIQSGELIED
jgi:hypothetical protein